MGTGRTWLATCLLLTALAFPLASCGSRGSSPAAQDAASTEAAADVASVSARMDALETPSPTPEPSPAASPLGLPVVASPTASDDAGNEPSATPAAGGANAGPAPLASPSPANSATPSASPTPSRSPVVETRYPPRDDCAKLPGWTAFRARLAAAVDTRDAAALTLLSAPDIKLDYGGGAGRKELARRLGDPQRDLWKQIARVMPLGCAVADGIVVMPWYFWHLPDDVDPGVTMLVTGEDAVLRKRPDPDAEALARLDWTMVTLAPGYDPNARYTRVITRAGKVEGYVQTTKLRSVLAYRLIAERRGGEWALTAFVSGD